MDQNRVPKTPLKKTELEHKNFIDSLKVYKIKASINRNNHLCGTTNIPFTQLLGAPEKTLMAFRKCISVEVNDNHKNINQFVFSVLKYIKNDWY